MDLTDNSIDESIIITHLNTPVESKNWYPKVSFCIPTYNNESTIDKCLKSIVEQTYPNFEIIIVDGNSRDTTVAIAQKYTSHIYFDGGYLGSARQTSIDKANGEIIALFDSDIIIPHRKWLLNAIGYFNSAPNISTVWPLLVAPPDSSAFARLYQTYMYKIFITHRMNDPGIAARAILGMGNSLFVKEYIIEVGGIDRDIHWGEDFNLARKLKNHGYSVLYMDDPLYHDTMRSFRQFFRKQFVGANTFTKTGFELMGLSTSDVLYEHFVLGVRAMVYGIIVERDSAWLYYPFVLAVRVFAYLMKHFQILVSRGQST
jgi:glycosyltransferase involved in cell wall biosynthesis